MGTQVDPPEKPGAADRSVPVLSYAAHTGAMRGGAPAWVWVLAGVYLLMLAGLASLPLIIAFTDGPREVIASAAVLAAVLLVSEFALLIVPIRVASRRPVTRTPFWIALVVGSLLGGVLVAALVYGLVELGLGKIPEESGTVWWLPTVLLAAWGFWFAVFASMKSLDPAAAGAPANRLHRYLLAGSIAELLVAVPAHIVVRNRTYCCAGFATGTAIVTGVVVMLLAFGPSVAILFYRRWKDRTSG